ncbi:hypothetical protein [Koleobacter methoxysyntrophicus]|nr:hypothetical protein [Koleobacter methoxysyntrophicus]
MRLEIDKIASAEGFAYLSNLDVERFYSKETGFVFNDDSWIL